MQSGQVPIRVSGSYNPGPMVAPKVEHKQRQQVETYDEVTRTCPEGYEGHFVDYQEGFDSRYYWSGGTGTASIGQIWIDGSGVREIGYTICFKKEFMDQIRKNPDLLAPRPAPPKPA